MGFYDKVKLDQACLELGIAEGTTFETKSLHAGWAEFTITANGRLVEHLYRYEPDPADSGRSVLGKRVPAGDKTIDYHGDLLMLKIEPEGRSQSFVARFTHGQLEWMRPAADYPAENMELLLEQGAR